MLGPRRAAPKHVETVCIVRIREVCGLSGMLPRMGTRLVPWVRNARSTTQCGRGQFVLGKSARMSRG